MNEKDSIKDLESQARNTKHLMDKLNRAAYGMTFDEAIRLGKENPPLQRTRRGQGLSNHEQSLWIQYIASKGRNQGGIYD